MAADDGDAFADGGVAGKIVEFAAIASLLFQARENDGKLFNRNIGAFQIVQGIAVGFAFKLPGIAALHQEGRQRRRQGGDRGNIAKQRDHQQRGDGVLKYPAQIVLVYHMADFVSKNRRQLLVIVGEMDQGIGDDNDAAGKGEGVGASFRLLRNSSR